MNRLNGSEFIANATLIRLVAERVAQLDELGKQTRILVDGLSGRTVQATTAETGDDHVPDSGG